LEQTIFPPKNVVRNGQSVGRVLSVISEVVKQKMKPRKRESRERWKRESTFQQNDKRVFVSFESSVRKGGGGNGRVMGRSGINLKNGGKGVMERGVSSRINLACCTKIVWQRMGWTG